MTYSLTSGVVGSIPDARDYLYDRGAPSGLLSI